jgi:hypothetical protein
MDAKFGFDDNADFRQKEVFELRDTTQEDPQEVEAATVSSVTGRISRSSCTCSLSACLPDRSACHLLTSIVRSQLYQARR